MYLVYYIPQTERPSVADLEAWGIGHAFEAPGRMTSCPVTRGPDGGAGLVLTDPRAQRVGYYPDEQTWRRVPLGSPEPSAVNREPEQTSGSRPKAQGSRTGCAWVGYWNAGRPTPDELAREPRLYGEERVLADGQRWCVPVVIGAPEDVAASIGVLRLPRKLELNDAGEFVAGEVEPQYRPLLEAAGWWYDESWAAAQRMAAGEPPDEIEGPEVQRMLAAAVTVLAGNYRVGKAEVVLLGLLDTQVAQDVLGTAIDIRTYVEKLRKKAAGGGPASSAGRADDIAPTA